MFTEAIVEKGKEFALKLVEKEIFKYLINKKEVDLENYFISKFLGKIKDLQIEEKECEKLKEQGKLKDFIKFGLEKIDESDEPFSTKMKDVLDEFNEDFEGTKKESALSRMKIMKRIINKSL